MPNEEGMVPAPRPLKDSSARGLALWIGCLALAGLLGACSPQQPETIAPLPSLGVPPGTGATAEDEYVLQPGDVVRVKYLYHPELEVKVPLEPVQPRPVEPQPAPEIRPMEQPPAEARTTEPAPDTRPRAPAPFRRDKVGLSLLGVGWACAEGWLTATTQGIAWSVIFFFASAAASSAYLTVSEIFPLEMRAIAISLFYAAGTGIGGFVGPALFGALIETGSRQALFIGYACAALLMCFAAVVTIVLGLAAERRPLEEVARPLCAE